MDWEAKQLTLDGNAFDKHCCLLDVISFSFILTVKFLYLFGLVLLHYKEHCIQPTIWLSRCLQVWFASLGPDDRWHYRICVWTAIRYTLKWWLQVLWLNLDLSHPWPFFGIHGISGAFLHESVNLTTSLRLRNI